MIDGEKVHEAYDTLQEAVALLQCAVDASNEEHIRTTVGIAVGMLLGVSRDLASSEVAADEA